VAHLEKLIAPDLKQCQAERRLGSFMSFGLPSMRRCTNTPTHIATEPKRSDRKRQGSMSLCGECLAVCSRQMPGVTFELIKR